MGKQVLVRAPVFLHTYIARETRLDCHEGAFQLLSAYSPTVAPVNPPERSHDT